MNSIDQKRTWLERAFAVWGGALGFVVGAAAVAWAGRWLGWWPVGEKYLRQFK